MDILSYILGFESGQSKGASTVVIEGGITCTDDGEANITITEDENNGE